VLFKTVLGLAENNIQEKPQSNLKIKHAPRIFTETCKIDWNKSADEIHNLIRGLSPYPAAFTYLDEKKLKIFNAKKEITIPQINPGLFDTDGKTFLRFTCTDGFVHILELQLEGKKKMNIEDFLRGYRFPNS